jgi:hypothetical protein
MVLQRDYAHAMGGGKSLKLSGQTFFPFFYFFLFSTSVLPPLLAQETSPLHPFSPNCHTFCLFLIRSEMLNRKITKNSCLLEV